MNTVIKRAWNKNKLVKVEDLTGMTFQAESGGHTFEISGVDDTGAAVSLSGTVEGRFLRADNAEIIISGTASGGKASVTLLEACYAIPGRFLLTVYVTSGGQKVAVYAATGSVVATSGTASGSIPPLVTDSVQANTGTFGSISAGDATVDGVLDVTPRRCSSTLSSAGWYRILRFDAANAFDVLGADGSIIEFFLSRVYNYTTNESHKINLLRAYNNNKFVGEESVSSTLGIDKIRLTIHDGGNDDRQAFIDIHYYLSTENPVAVHFNVYAHNSYADSWNSVNFTPVGTSPSGETVVTEYAFVANTDSMIAFTPTAGSNHAGYGNCWYSRSGRTVHLHIGLSGLTANTPQNAFIMPYGFRPITIAAANGAGGSTYTAISRLTVTTTGTVQIISDDQYACVDITYLADV